MKKNNFIKNVLIYCRESRDDGFTNYERIETQRDILVAYSKAKNLGNIIDIILDDNKSGTDFERLEPIKERIRNNEVDILLLKDASRLGRNILESLTFTAFLDEHKVELIFESEKYDEDMFPLIAWFNERRAKDDSTKIRRVLRHKMEGGEIVIKAPYGYTKQGNRLIINEEAAAVIREIFDLYLKGQGKYEIAAIINKKGCPTPSQLKSQYENNGRTYIWNKQHIERILGHVIYTGDMPYGMRKKISFKSKKYTRIGKEDWIIVPNHHEAIISKEIFNEAQERMQKCSKNRTRNTGKNIFSGLLFCGRCGAKLCRKTRNGKNPRYSCSKSNREGTVKDHRPNYGCYTHSVNESVLIQIAEDYLHFLINAPGFKETALSIINNQENIQSRTLKEIQSAKSAEEALKIKASKVYDDKLNGILPEYLFNEKIGEITKELKNLSENIEKSRQTLKEARESEKGGDKLQSLSAQIRTKGINNQSLSLLFKKIIVFNQKEISTEAKNQYNISDEEYVRLFENGGLLFIQNFAFRALESEQP